ncbi:MAG: GT4 family glycosyltransferase PelF [Deltaproteobacteria bacterium]|jgi:polysaccharide biosynthesis protein PelF|nr:GT4 family glycosyltransferase PelF [Deltaproteobacteria bacterium]
MSDVCLVLEGTYPYVRGGVSSWVHDLINGMPDIKFSIVSIMPTPGDTKEEKYLLPSNVDSLLNIHLHDYRFQPKLLKKRRKDLFEYFELFYQGIETASKDHLETFLVKLMGQRANIDLAYAFSSKDFWNSVKNLYNKIDPTLSFLDFFWNYRFTFLPLLKLIKSNIPPSPLFHTISTGYAGTLASLARIKLNSNMIVTEHGIYTKERRIEIAQANWLYRPESNFIKADNELGFFKEWWIKYFVVMSKLSYTYADDITTLYEGNKQSQIEDGADPNKITIIPNGIHFDSYKEIREARKAVKKRRTLAFIGRIVPIKDVKTLIKACKVIVDRIPDVQIFLIGPQEEESSYYQECSVLIRLLGLEHKLIFTGHVDLKEYYSKIDVILLTSISEAQPLVILEAMASGIPSVATDVGSCRELLEGTTEDDRKLGASGIITKFYSTEETSEAAIKLLTDDDTYNSMSEVCVKRVEQFYNQRDVITSYRNLYEKYI